MCHVLFRDLKKSLDKADDFLLFQPKMHTELQKASATFLFRANEPEKFKTKT